MTLAAPFLQVFWVESGFWGGRACFPLIFELIDIGFDLFRKLFKAVFTHFSLTNGNFTPLTLETCVGFDQPKPVLPDIPIYLFNIDFSGLGYLLGGSGGAGGKVMKNFFKIIVFFFNAGRAGVPTAGNHRKDPATSGAIGQAHEKVLRWGTVTCLSL